MLSSNAVDATQAWQQLKDHTVQLKDQISDRAHAIYHDGLLETCAKHGHSKAEQTELATAALKLPLTIIARHLHSDNAHGACIAGALANTVSLINIGAAHYNKDSLSQPYFKYASAGVESIDLLANIKGMFSSSRRLDEDDEQKKIEGVSYLLDTYLLSALETCLSVLSTHQLAEGEIKRAHMLQGLELLTKQLSHLIECKDSSLRLLWAASTLATIGMLGHDGITKQLRHDTTKYEAIFNDALTRDCHHTVRWLVGQKDFATTYMDYKADKDQRYTPVQLALRHGKLAAAALLKNLTPETAAQKRTQGQKQTTFMLAALNFSKDYKNGLPIDKFIETFWYPGASFNDADKDRKTLLELLEHYKPTADSLGISSDEFVKHQQLINQRHNAMIDLIKRNGGKTKEDFEKEVVKPINDLLDNSLGKTPNIPAAVKRIKEKVTNGTLPVNSIVTQTQATIKDNKVFTLLYFAVKRKDADLVKFLLEHGADPDEARNPHGGDTKAKVTARGLAQQSGSDEIKQLFH